jgi:hypothetical protein
MFRRIGLVAKRQSFDQAVRQPVGAHSFLRYLDGVLDTAMFEGSAFYI